MRQISAWLFYSLDGAVDSPDQWQFDYDDEMSADLNAGQERQDAILLGRGTYAEWADYWPTAPQEIGFTNFINNTPKYVVSTTLDTVDWQNTTLIKGDLSEVAALKEGDGGEIGVYGSPTLTRSLLTEGLLDELTLLVHPVLAGSGHNRLFPQDAEMVRLDLTSSVQGNKGTMVLKYRPRTP
ncbi:riboflavin biosynthesis protein RibD [Actinophytocola xinjiangensis]|uniref:Riboflavin biosynthesis protein RibD n=1 Tax=Actinophytocola xinjiangensis TaxID=485602 RepID=A0A7Z0WRF3_9PSEU|nr:dihydrofolate reductase family protein [Actinophytocola xinjiangensis]OLF12942.1 riboflavin biosynthesis protein RibD [Actinophytocola xinjiangensis]